MAPKAAAAAGTALSLAWVVSAALCGAERARVSLVAGGGLVQALRCAASGVTGRLALAGVSAAAQR
jgi:hypothetical protein